MSSRTVDDMYLASVVLIAGARGMLGHAGSELGIDVAKATHEQYPSVTARDMVAVAVALEVAHCVLAGRLANADLFDLMGTAMSSFEDTWQELCQEVGGDDGPEA